MSANVRATRSSSIGAMCQTGGGSAASTASHGSTVPEALARVCAEFNARYAELERTDPLRYMEADVDYMARQCSFIRPAFQAALELGADDAWDHIRASIEDRLDACTRPLRHALP